MKPEFITEKPKINIIVSICLMTLYVATFLIDLATTKKVTLVSFIMCTCTLAFISAIFYRFRPLYFQPAVWFAFFALYLGTMLRFYDLIPIYDLLLHAASGVLLTFGGHLFQSILLWKMRDYVIPMRLTVVCSVLFAMAAAAVWEIWEYSGDVLLGLSSQGTGLDDTMTDIIAGCVAAVVGGVVLYFILKRKKTQQSVTD